jgi:hypothetical protein
MIQSLETGPLGIQNVRFTAFGLLVYSITKTRKPRKLAYDHEFGIVFAPARSRPLGRWAEHPPGPAKVSDSTRKWQPNLWEWGGTGEPRERAASLGTGPENIRLVGVFAGELS